MAAPTTPEQRAAFMAKQRALPTYFMGDDGRCYFCKADVIDQQIAEGNDGGRMVTGCRECNRSFVD